MRNVRVVDAVDAVPGAREFWLRHQDHANNDLPQFELVCAMRPDVISPLIAVLLDGDRVRALLAGRLEQSTFGPPIGYVQPLRFSARVITVLHQGNLGELHAEDAAAMLGALDARLAAGEADAVYVHHVAEGSALLAGFERGSRGWRARVLPRWSVHRSMTIPKQPDFLAERISAKHRSWLRKRQRNLEADFQGRLEWRWLTQVRDVGTLCAALEGVAALTYQRGLGVGFFDNRDFRERLASFAARGLLRVQLLEIDGKARAFWFGTIHADTFHSSETGYDPALRDYEVGTLMFIRMVDALAREGVAALDFGLGDAHYKRRFGDHDWRETSAWVFAPTVKGATMRIVLELAVGLDSLARAVLVRTRLLDRLKSAWRRRASGSPERVAARPIDHDARQHP